MILRLFCENRRPQAFDCAVPLRATQMKAPLRLRRPQVFRIFVHQEHERYVDQGDARMEMGASVAGESGAGFCGYGSRQGNTCALAGGLAPLRSRRGLRRRHAGPVRALRTLV